MYILLGFYLFIMIIVMGKIQQEKGQVENEEDPLLDLYLLIGKVKIINPINFNLVWKPLGLEGDDPRVNTNLWLKIWIN